MKSSEGGTELPSAAARKPSSMEHPRPGVGGELPKAPANGEMGSLLPPKARNWP